VELEVEDWFDSLPSSSSSTASSDGSGARVLARMVARLRRRLATAARGRSSRAAVAGHGAVVAAVGLAAVARVGSKEASV
jgi:hypothetical protein